MPCAEEICGTESSSARAKRRKLKFKLNLEREQLKTDVVQTIKHNIAHNLGIRTSSLYLCRIKDGCVLLEFLIPQSVVDQVFPLSKEKIITLFTEVKVLSIATDNETPSDILVGLV